MKAAGKGPAVLRLNNLKRVMTQLRHARLTSRQDVALALDLSKNTVSLIIDDLLTQGIVQELGPVSVAAAGRPKIEIALRPEKLKSAGIMVTRQRIHWQVYDYFSQNIAGQSRHIDSSDPDQLLHELAAICQTLQKAHPELIGIAIGMPGIIDPRRGFVHFSAPLGWQNIEVLASLRPRVKLPLQLINNVNAAALLAVQQQQLSKTQSHFYLRIADGVGGALINRGSLFTGSSWTAGEIGHLIIQRDGPLCRCGRRGCLETLISQPAIQQRLSKLRPARHEDEAANFAALMREAGTHLGYALSQVIQLINPASIIIDAPWSNYPAFNHAVEHTVRDNTLTFTSAHTSLHFLAQHLLPVQGLALAVIEQYEQTDY